VIAADSLLHIQAARSKRKCNRPLIKVRFLIYRIPNLRNMMFDWIPDSFN
jgi:hypothetical protein